MCSYKKPNHHLSTISFSRKDKRGEIKIRTTLIISILFLAGNTFALPNCPDDISVGRSSIFGVKLPKWHNCFGTYIAPVKKPFSIGDKYVGEWQDGKYHGQGTFTRAYGAKWEGEWKEGKLNGQGTFTGREGEQYIGGFKDGEEHGNGTQISLNGKRYDGQWKEGRLHGRVKITWPNGDQWIGEWDRGYQKKGTLTKYIENDPRKRKENFIERLGKIKNENLVWIALEKEIDKIDIEIKNQELIFTALFDRCTKFGWQSDDHIAACIKQESYRDLQMQQQQYDMQLLEAKLDRKTSTKEKPFFLDILNLFAQQQQFEQNKQMQNDIAILKSSNRSIQNQQNTQNALRFLYEGN